MAGMTDSVGAAAASSSASGAGSGMMGNIGAGLNIAGTILNAKAARNAGRATNDAAEFTAKQMDIESGQAIASAKRQAMEQRRRAVLTQSRALAVAAASGGASDPGVLKIIGDLEGEGTYRAMTALYQGENLARQYRMGAAAKRYEGASAQRTGEAALFPAMLRGGATLFSRFGGNGPPSTSGADKLDRFDASSGFDDFEMDGQN